LGRLAVASLTTTEIHSKEGGRQAGERERERMVLDWSGREPQGGVAGRCQRATCQCRVAIYVFRYGQRSAVRAERERERERERGVGE
jgi:hypothetical protein